MSDCGSYFPGECEPAEPPEDAEPDAEADVAPSLPSNVKITPIPLGNGDDADDPEDGNSA